MTDIAAIHHQIALQRSFLYQHLAEMLTYPTEDFLQSCRTGDRDKQISELLLAFPYRLSWQADSCTGDGDLSTLPSEYMRVFELPIDGRPCALYGGVYTGNRREVMEELLRYYRFFGLSVDKAINEDLPDSIPTLLEFFQFLTYKESIATADDEIASVRLVQRDLLERHLTKWIPSIEAQLARRKPPAFYQSTLGLLSQFASAELGLLAA
jgi:DMSO reductase family type II enzyme chaperone